VDSVNAFREQLQFTLDEYDVSDEQFTYEEGLYSLTSGSYAERKLIEEENAETIYKWILARRKHYERQELSMKQKDDGGNSW